LHVGSHCLIEGLGPRDHLLYNLFDLIHSAVENGLPNGIQHVIHLVVASAFLSILLNVDTDAWLKANGEVAAHKEAVAFEWLIEAIVDAHIDIIFGPKYVRVSPCSLPCPLRSRCMHLHLPDREGVVFSRHDLLGEGVDAVEPILILRRVAPAENLRSVAPRAKR